MTEITGPFPDLLTALEAARASDKGITFVRSGAEVRFVTYRDLYDRALGLLHFAQSHGVTQGAELVIHVDNNEAIIDSFWACQLGGIIPIPVAVGATYSHQQKLYSILNALDDAYLLTTTSQLERYRQTTGPSLLGLLLAEKQDRILLLDQMIESVVRADTVQPNPSDLALVQFSSGSTGEPKGVSLTHANILANIHSSTVCAQFESTDVFLSWMPLTHDMGMIGFHLVPLVNQLHQIIMPTDLFVRRPALWLQTAATYQATVLSSPNFGFRHALSRLRLENDVDLSAVRLIFNGAEPISAEVARDFMRACTSFGLHKFAMFPVYGLAEASLAVTFPQPGSKVVTTWVQRSKLRLGEPVVATEPGEGAMELVSLGSPVLNTQIMLVDNNGVDVANKVVGHILIRGPNVTQSYYNNKQATAELIQSDGWVRTGDLGFMLDGNLYVSGREKDLVIVNGQNLFANDLEELCTAVPEVEPGKVAIAAVQSGETGGDLPIVFVVYRADLSGFAKLSDRITTTLTEKAGIDRAVVVPVHRIPKTTSGKVRRQELIESYLAGEFDEPLAQLDAIQTSTLKSAPGNDANQLEVALLGICNNIIADHPIGLQQNIFDAGTSSLKLAQIHERIDERWPDALELTDFFDYPTVSELAAYLQAKLSDVS